MTAGTHDITIYRNAPVSIPLAFVDGNGDPVSFAGFIRDESLAITGTLTDGASPVTFPELVPAGTNDGKDMWSDTGDDTVWDYAAYFDAGDSVWKLESPSAVWTSNNASATSPVGLSFVADFPATGTPTVALNAARDFLCQVRDNADSPVIVTLTVSSTNLAGGLLDLTATADATKFLPERDALWGLADYAGAYWLEGVARLRKKIPHT